VNAYGGMDDPEMAAVIRAYRPTVIAYHVEDVRHCSDPGAFDAVQRFFKRQEALAQECDLAPEQLICDPGIGFGKSLSQNVCILQRLTALTDGGRRRIGIGVSRKSHLGMLLKRGLALEEIPSVGERLEAGLAATAIAALNGATSVRTHDVRATRRFLATLEQLTSHDMVAS
ncbi:MAG: dihydropteroate synthase, partial [bacterium]|nr:dihydropteroate synthase [bacterium]